MKKISKDAVGLIIDLKDKSEAILLDLLVAIEEQLDIAQEYMSGRSDKWQEQHGGEYEDFISEIEQMRDNVQCSIDSVLELEPGDIVYGV